MKEFSKILAASIVSSLICCLLFWLLVERKKISKAQFDLVTTHTEYVKDTNTYRAVIDNTTTINNPVKIIERAVPFNAPVDSLAIYKSYYNRYVYERNFDDTLLSWTMIDTVSENRFSPFSKMSYKLKRPVTTIVNNYAPAKRFNIYAGFRTAHQANTFEFTPVVGIKTKTQWQFDLGYNPNKKELQAGAYYNLLK
jgi:hypothetical protein